MWKHLRAIILLPGMVTIVIPGLILWPGETDSFGLWQAFPASRVVLPLIGVICICLGLSADGRHNPAVRDGRQGHPRSVGTPAEARGPRRLPPRPQSDDLRGDFRPAGGVGAHGVPAALLLVPRVRGRQRLLHPALGGAWARQTLRRRLPDLQAERAEMGSEVEAVGGWVGAAMAAHLGDEPFLDGDCILVE